MDFLLRINQRINGVVWGPAMLILLIGTGVYFSLCTGFFQFTHFRCMLRVTLGGIFSRRRDKSRKGISPLQAVSTALAGTMGVGNITGVATAISLGGAGAIFWMWVSALFGMMTKYAEVVLAVKFRGTDKNGAHYGGPMLYLSKGLHAPVLAWVFSLLCVTASFGIGNMTQANAISGAMLASFSIPVWVSGVAAAAVVGLIVVGGLRRIATITELTIPLMSVLYILFALIVIGKNIMAVPDALSQIVQGAFNTRSALGGCGGYSIARAMHYGFARGVFSNEAGLGSAPIAHAAADTDSPVQQGMWGMFEVFADTLVCCTLTALVLLTTGVLELPLEGGAMTSAAFSHSLGSLGGVFVSVSLVFFAISSMLGWCYYGEASLRHLTGGSPLAAWVYRYLFILLIPVGAVTQLETVWSISDTLNGLMAVPNLIGILGLSGVVFTLTRDYIKKEHR
ncbi:sodium:alanine symporter family protein [Hydrogenoanaerobacterium sp.]|uniref:alanine/glycine:cation symporter family protein n=1 Tax=Hydrogenoanaerobacterium sp. TaxID=2953763 RepID=UPI00289CD065|nr:sodium:alanine symporter family protein [Hydrogenoanaerobacterium sp.]